MFSLRRFRSLKLIEKIIQDFPDISQFEPTTRGREEYFPNGI